MQKTPQRIMIFERPGSGKSTFALELHRKLGIPLYHLDKHFFESRWIERDYEKFLQIQRELVTQDKWILDGNNTKSLEMRWARANLVLYFNFPRPLCYWRIFKRLFFKDPTIDDRAPECPETARFSLLSYMWNFENRVQDSIRKCRENYPNAQFIECKSDQQLFDLTKELFGTSIS